MVIAINSHLRHAIAANWELSEVPGLSLAQDKTVDTLTIEVIPNLIISLAAQIPKQVKKLEV